MTPADALKVATREVNRQLRAVRFNFMADPRAAEIRLEKIAELEDTLATLGITKWQ